MIWHEAEYLHELESIEEDCRKVPPLLQDLARRRGFAASSPKVTSMLLRVALIAERCREEREKFGLWREDNLEPDEVLEAIDEQLGEIVKTLDSSLSKPRTGQKTEF